MPHPFVQRLIGSIRRELLDQTSFCAATDLENKLQSYQLCYNKHRCHAGPDGFAIRQGQVSLNINRWQLTPRFGTVFALSLFLSSDRFGG